MARRTDGRWTTAVTEWTPCTGKRSQGRPYKRWRDEIDKYWGTPAWTEHTRNRKYSKKPMLRPSSCSGVTIADMMMMTMIFYLVGKVI